MYLRILRIFWRIATAVLVVSGAYASTFMLFPYLDQRIPAFWAAVLGYGAFAYIILPLTIRFWHIVFRPHHIPRYTTTSDGWAADPVNIAVIAGSERQLIAAMERSGWYTADPPTLKNILREAYAIVANRNYFTAPFSAFYLFGRKTDIGFQRPACGRSTPRYRHHVRFWQLVDEPEVDRDDHFGYWLMRFRNLIGRRRKVWIGAAIEDISPLGFRWRNLQLTHHNSHNHTAERDYIIDTLHEAGLVKSVHTIKDGEPFRMRSQNIGTSFVVDGNIKVIELRHQIFKGKHL